MVAEVGETVVHVREIMDPSHGLHVWPASIVLAEYIWHHQGLFREKCVVELGCGTGLAGIVAALVGAQVTLTDSASLPRVLDNAEHNCKLNRA